MKFCSLAMTAVAAVSLITGCAQQPPSRSPLAQARVGVFLKKGVTTQSQVIEKLGTPNIITTDSEGREMWTYQQHSISGSSADISIEGAGVADNKSAFFNHGALSAWLGGSTYTESSKTATLVVKFNRHQVVDEYQSFYSSF